MKTRKSLVWIVALVLALGCLSLVAGCGPSKEEQIKKDVSSMLDLIKGLDNDVVDQAVTSMSKDGTTDALSMLGIDSKEFITALFTGFDYSIDKVVVNDDGKSGTVTLTITAKSLNSINDFDDQLTKGIETALANGEDPYKATGKVFMDIISSTTPTKNAPIDVPVQLNDKTWEITDAGMASIINVMFPSE